MGKAWSFKVGMGGAQRFCCAYRIIVRRLGRKSVRYPSARPVCRTLLAVMFGYRFSASLAFLAAISGGQCLARHVGDDGAGRHRVAGDAGLIATVKTSLRSGQEPQARWPLPNSKTKTKPRRSASPASLCISLRVKNSTNGFGRTRYRCWLNSSAPTDLG